MKLIKIFALSFLALPTLSFASPHVDLDMIQNEAMKKVVEINIESKLDLTDKQKEKFRDEIIKYNRSNIDREDKKKVLLEEIEKKDKNNYSKILNDFNKGTDRILSKEQKEKMLSYQEKIKENNDIANKKAEKIKEKLYQKRVLEDNVQSYDTLK